MYILFLYFVSRSSSEDSSTSENSRISAYVTLVKANKDTEKIPATNNEKLNEMLKIVCNMKQCLIERMHPILFQQEYTIKFFVNFKDKTRNRIEELKKELKDINKKKTSITRSTS